jgi:hypothetical protein
MDAQHFKAPFLRHTDIWKLADELRARFLPHGSLPVPVGVTITDYRIISEFKREEIPSDMKQLISALDVFRSGTATLIT